MKTLRLRVVLRGAEPAVSRVIDVPASTTLPELHELLQAAMGWTDSHLHQFVTAQATYGVDIPGEDVWPEDQRDESDALLTDLGAEFEYHYDFGDGWIHDVDVLGRGDAEPGCVDGRGACPPEDCGGIGGYAELLEILADPTHPDYERMHSWVGNRLRPFDRAATDQWVRRVVGEVPESVRLLMDFVADGVKLTPGGRLPRTIARGMQEHRPDWHPLGRPVATEDNLPALAALHDLLRDVGLLRPRHGVLAPTRAANDDRAIVRRLRSAFGRNEFSTVVTELTIGQLAAHGPMRLPELASRVRELLGWGWQTEGRPVDDEDVHMAIAGQSRIMKGLDLIEHPDWHTWATGPSALSLLPGATMLAEVWSNE